MVLKITRTFEYASHNIPDASSVSALTPRPPLVTWVTREERAAKAHLAFVVPSSYSSTSLRVSLTRDELINLEKLLWDVITGWNTD